jgi:hypothetical protein
MKPLQTAQQSDGIDLSGGMVAKQPSLGQVLTQPTDKTDKEYLGYTGPAGVAGATIKGLDDVGRGTAGALRGAWDAARHPIDTVKGMAALPAQAAQVPAAIHDINQSVDPTGRYLDAAQDTASQGAGQALTALATAGAAKGVADAAPYVGPVGGALIKGYAKKVIPDEAITAYKAVKGVKSGQLTEAFKDPGAPLPEDPGTFPGAPNPETPDPQLLKARALFNGSSSPPDPAAGLGTIKQSAAPGQAGQLAESMQKPTPAEVAPGFQRGSLKDLLYKGVAPEAASKSAWAKNVTNNPSTPLRQQMPTTAPPSATPPSGAISGAADLEGHTPVQSSWIRSYKYDPAAREFEMAPKSGTPVRLGDVSPEQAQGFADAKSQGRAWQQIKNNPLVAKLVNGKWVTTPRAGASADPQ